MIIIGRKSRNTDQALIKAGIELIAQGNYDPTVRAICTLANVNQGMFVYYFGFKEEYMKVLFQKIYEDYLSKLQDYPEKDAKAAIQLQQIFYRMTKYFIENFNTANFLKPYITAKLPPISQTTASSILSSSAHLSNRPSVKAISAAI